MLKKIIGFFVVAVLSILVVCSFHVSHARYFFRARYSISLALVEHFTFSPGEIHTFQIPYDGYYAFQLWGVSGDDSENTRSGGRNIYEAGDSDRKVTAASYFKKGENLIIVVAMKADTINDVETTDVRLSSGALNDRVLVADGDSSYVDEAFSATIPANLPDRSLYGADPKQGYVIISFIGK
jgi:hypothetical protein